MSLCPKTSRLEVCGYCSPAHLEDLPPPLGGAGLHQVQDGQDLLAQLHLPGQHSGLTGGHHHELHLGLEQDVVVGVGEGLQVGEEGEEVEGGGGTGEESPVHGDTPGHGLVRGEREGAGGAGPGGVVVEGMGGEEERPAVLAQESTQVRAQL